jgi:hypothetical protein
MTQYANSNSLYLAGRESLSLDMVDSTLHL